MEIRNQLKPNLGLILLSISIIVGCLILKEHKITYTEMPITSLPTEYKNSITGAMGALSIPVDLTTNGNDVTYKSELKIGKGEHLQIVLSNGTVEKIEGQNIFAKFFHVSKLLSVEYEVDNVKYLNFYNSPIKWMNKR